MPYLLDTCALSELIAKNPGRAVITRIRTLPAPETFIPAIAIGQIADGIHRMDVSKRKSELTDWLWNQLLPAYQYRIIPFGQEESLRWGQLRADTDAAGTPMEIEDSLIAATALAHNLTVVTRNEKHFAPANVLIFNPWH